jgi:hypothetical protein
MSGPAVTVWVDFLGGGILEKRHLDARTGAREGQEMDAEEYRALRWPVLAAPKRRLWRRLWRRLTGWFA